jgi:hypothetical protein
VDVTEAMPQAVRAGLARMAMDGVHFAPVRHHSPSCALALQAMVRELRPAAILIEGPDTFDALLPLLHDDRTRPPVAILSQAPPPGSDDEGRGAPAAFFPFCEYSPEWVALRLARETRAEVAFIDLPWQTRPRASVQDDQDGERARSLMAERYLAHSAYVKALAAASGCRDQDELWDHLFELRSPSAVRNWRAFFADVFVYCALARSSYEIEVLEAEGSLARERHMAAHIRRRRDALAASGRAGPIVVLIGGFHTIALQDLLVDPASLPAAPRPPDAPGRDWLIRYSFDRLDALNGYTAGMPSPAWHQWVWDSTQANPDGPHLVDVAARAIAGLAYDTRARGLAEQRSTADVQAAVLQAVRLAQLRGHAGPGREDVLDALRSCFIKGAVDDGNAGFATDLRFYLGGSLLGDVPPSSGSPPLLEDARRQARTHGIRLEDSAVRTMRLDLYRKEAHRRRSRFIHLMDYIGAGLGQWRGGPDFVAGARLELLVEEWDVAWTPLVEARLIDLSAQGSALEDVALARLRLEEAALAADGRSRSAGSAVNLLVRACLMGLQRDLPRLLALVSQHLAEDADLSSVTACAHRLLTLWQASEPLGMQDNASVHALLQQAWSASIALLPGLAAVKVEQEDGAVRNLVDLRAIHAALVGPGRAEVAHGTAWHDALQRLASAPGAAGVALAAGALLFLEGVWRDPDLAAALVPHFGPGADAAQAVRALGGLMTAAPELLLTQERLLADLDGILTGWDDATFLRHLPELRLAFAGLKPQETASLAETLAHTHAGLDGALAAVHYDVSEADALAGAALQANLVACLRRDGLTTWIERSAP